MTYFRIVGNLSASAKLMIVTMIQPEPKHRPKVDDLLQHEFMMGYCPPSLPVSCLTMSPRFDNIPVNKYTRKPLLEINSEYTKVLFNILWKRMKSTFNSFHINRKTQRNLILHFQFFQHKFCVYY